MVLKRVEILVWSGDPFGANLILCSTDFVFVAHIELKADWLPQEPRITDVCESGG
jgi:hypothetical protein